MDINEPSLMDVAHDTINSTQGLAPFPDLAADGRAGPEFRPDQTLLCLSCSHARRPEDLSCPGLDKYVEIFVGPGRESQSIFSSLGFLITPRTEIFPLIDKREGSPLEQTLKG